ncbi:hypothetical protein C1891_01930 [Pseudomonas sp. GW456-12-1-14-TSB6]|nr:hypothetical protein C1891_01930 [Pseudomonas sp. GW456-12-1-14-TSB6]
MIVPTSRRRTVCVGMPRWTLRVRFRDAERPGLHSHAERGNEHVGDQRRSATTPINTSTTNNTGARL